MKYKSLLSILALSTIATACGGGGGGGHIPATTLPNNPVTPSCSGPTCMSNDGLSNSAKRTELYNKANDISPYSLRRVSKAGTSGETINNAYTGMKSFLVDIPIDTSDADKLRKNLILAGFENLPENDTDLQAWTNERQNMIKKHAQKAYNMYGTEKSVYLDNVKLSLVDDGANQDTYINFIIDNNKNINGIEISENSFGAEAVTDKLVSVNGNDFSGSAQNNTLHKYVFKYDGRNLMIEVSEDTPGTEPSLAAIKEKLQLKLQERAKEDSDAGSNWLENNKIAISEKIKELANADSLNHNVIEREFAATYESAAKNLGGVKGNNLLYSDFGTLSLTGTRTNTTDSEVEQIKKTQVFAGGYDALKITPKITDNLHFEGDAVGGVNYTQIVSGDETIKDSATMKLEGGKAKLDFANGKETLNASFNNWYNVDVTKDLSTGKGTIAFSNGNVIADDKFKFKDQNDYKNDDFLKEKWDTTTNNMTTGAMDVGYYGKDGRPSEATGYVMYHEEVNSGVKDTSSGKDLLDVLNIQIGVGMQKK